jgi:hypothetical protein
MYEMITCVYVLCTDVYIHICTYLWCLTQGVIRVSSQHNFADLVQNAMVLFKIPLGLFPGLIREVFLQEVKKVDCFLEVSAAIQAALTLECLIDETQYSNPCTE